MPDALQCAVVSHFGTVHNYYTQMDELIFCDFRGGKINILTCHIVLAPSSSHVGFVGRILQSFGETSCPFVFWPGKTQFSGEKYDLAYTRAQLKSR